MSYGVKILEKAMMSRRWKSFWANPRALNFIDGEIRSSVDGATIANVNPSTLQVISDIPRSKIADVDIAVKAAARASKQWAATPISSRTNLLERVASALEVTLFCQNYVAE